MKHLDLFSGIGGFALAASRVWTDHNVVGFCEIDPFCQKVLKKHWPGVPIYDDIKILKGSDFGRVDILTGGFPCQPYSVAGKRRGKEDDRALWPEMLRVISEVHPTWIVGENVSGFIHMGLDDCITDLEGEGYEVQSFIIPACAVGAPHRRDRVWIVAHAGDRANRTDRRQVREKDGLQKINRQEVGSGELGGTDGDAAYTKLHGLTSTQGQQKIAGMEQQPGREKGQEGSVKPERSDTRPALHASSNEDVADTGLLRPPKHEKQTAGIEQCGEDAADTQGGKPRQQTEQEGREDSGRGNIKDAANTCNQRLQRGQRQEPHDQRPASHGPVTQCHSPWSEPWIEAASRLCRMDDGLPRRVDRTARLKALGNAIVPQVAEQIFKAIKQADMDK